MSGVRTPLVYLTDDDVSFNQLLVAVLKKYGVKCETFETSEMTIRRMKVLPPDLFIIDLNLGKSETGLELLCTLRRLIGNRIPIVIVSSETEIKSISHALELGANDYLLKPLTREILISKLLQYISTPDLSSSHSQFASLIPTHLETQLNLDVQLSQVEEGGIVLISKHLILKGSVITLSGAPIKDIFGKDGTVLATVVSSELNLVDETYSISVEFDWEDHGISENIRNWLVKRLEL